MEAIMMVDVPGVPRTAELTVLVPNEDGHDVLYLNYIPGLHCSVTFVGRLHECSEGVEAHPYVAMSYRVNASLLKVLPDNETAVSWLVHEAKQQRKVSEASLMQGGTDA
tara:strand:- start:167 stop:493 length:327 start_codon:yes stop_codon:yes gene_type:complete